MPGEGQPLSQNFAIVDKDGKPTLYFIRWAQERQVDITAGITLEQAQQLIDDWAAAREIETTGGIEGGGDLSANRTLSLVDSGVAADTYGDADHVARITVDAKGRVTAAEDVAIIPEAPMDGQKYARQNGAWVALP